MQHYYISDIHIGHKNALTFDNKPWDSLEDYHRDIILLWNAKVTDKDIVHILGDFAHTTDVKLVVDVLSQLVGKKHLIRGNHDRFIDKIGFDQRLFQNICEIEYVHDNGKRIVCSHYPMLAWQNSHHDSIHFYGHLHLNGHKKTEGFFRVPRTYNTFLGLANYAPATADEIIKNFDDFVERGELESEIRYD